mmetsp:Transcript_26729/g.58309  ORF Transcript_26729/g.58309 Transcript_26729/m.58309 type:complete len:208 (-) Transcript_26729:209-832(-)
MPRSLSAKTPVFRRQSTMLVLVAFSPLSCSSCDSSSLSSLSSSSSSAWLEELDLNLSEELDLYRSENLDFILSEASLLVEVLFSTFSVVSAIFSGFSDFLKTFSKCVTRICRYPSRLDMAEMENWSLSSGKWLRSSVIFATLATRKKQTPAATREATLLEPGFTTAISPKMAGAAISVMGRFSCSNRTLPESNTWQWSISTYSSMMR